MTPVQLETLQKYPTFDAFYKDWSPGQLIVNYDNINTILQSLAVLVPRRSIEDINACYTDGTSKPAVVYLNRWLEYLNKFSNINKQLTETTAVAYMIYKDYKHLYLTDLKIIFEKIMRAEYGTFYGSVDAQRILYAFMQYNEDRTNIRKNLIKKMDSAVQTYMDTFIRTASMRINAQLESIQDNNDRLAEKAKLWEEERPKLKQIQDEFEENEIKKYQQ